MMFGTPGRPVETDRPPEVFLAIGSLLDRDVEALRAQKLTCVQLQVSNLIRSRLHLVHRKLLATANEHLPHHARPLRSLAHSGRARCDRRRPDSEECPMSRALRQFYDSFLLYILKYAIFLDVFCALEKPHGGSIPAASTKSLGKPRLARAGAF
jgi:hypothetical protein